MKAATTITGNTFVVREISIHAAREGGDCKLGTFGQNAPIFQSTPPVKAATAKGKVIACPVEFQSTPPVKAATRTAFWSGEVRVISIHAAREGGDEQRLAKLEARLNISIHAAREGGDSLKTSLFRNILISIHAAREGGDLVKLFYQKKQNIFQSTPPVKAATSEFIATPLLSAISIHAAREGGDSTFLTFS